MPKLKVKYIKADSYNPSYANGAIGGVNTKGEIIIHFYTEALELPKSQSFAIEGDKLKGEIINEKIPKEDGNTINVDRVINTGVIMSYAEANQVYQWLGKHLETLKLKKEHNGSGN